MKSLLKKDSNLCMEDGSFKGFALHLTFHSSTRAPANHGADTLWSNTVTADRTLARYYLTKAARIRIKK
jgi:hypothetical protein